jgi:hypothetical protein
MEAYSGYAAHRDLDGEGDGNGRTESRPRKRPPPVSPIHWLVSRDGTRAEREGEGGTMSRWNYRRLGFDSTT